MWIEVASLDAAAGLNEPATSGKTEVYISTSAEPSGDGDMVPAKLSPIV
ncbi:hypothetical protein HL653_17600 [Sphingomonas sp. AP4-R1]|nr:hypothetical protein [Sphingomonas sp. AP4-R1]QJU59333.1 hypothetical protein HL653_17600 [Sphingomonas sp. AP4-R1]